MRETKQLNRIDLWRRRVHDSSIMRLKHLIACMKKGDKIKNAVHLGKLVMGKKK